MARHAGERRRSIALKREVLLWLTLVGAGCGTSKERQLQDVAKDWCETIRASQVIPVYPLTEDLQPGDVFLVQTPIQRQEDLYKEKGFLPLDQMVTRLHGLAYGSFYEDAYFKGDYASVPHDRPSPQPATAAPNPPPADVGATPGRRFAGSPMPMAAFPSYTFEVSRSAGMKVAIPVQGVPVGLGLMGTSRATGTITISDGLTYGIDSEDALRKLRVWADRPEVRREISDVASLVKGELYLRVVTRVYFAGAVNVLLQDSRAGGGGLDVGEAKPIEFPDLRSDDPEKVKKAVDAHAAVLEKLSGAMNSSAPGGSVRIAFASSRTVGLHEEFPRPLAVGYLGFDVLVDKDGTLGPPVATRDILDRKLRLRPVAPGVRVDVVVIYLATVKECLERLTDDERALALARRMDEIAPSLVAGRVPETTCDWDRKTNTITARAPAAPPSAKQDFTAVTGQLSRMRDYAFALKAALGTPLGELKIARNDGPPAAATDDDVKALRAALKTDEAMLAAFEHDLRNHPDIVKAVAHFNTRFVAMP